MQCGLRSQLCHVTKPSCTTIHIDLLKKKPPLQKQLTASVPTCTCTYRLVSIKSNGITNSTVGMCVCVYVMKNCQGTKCFGLSIIFMELLKSARSELLSPTRKLPPRTPHFHFWFAHLATGYSFPVIQLVEDLDGLHLAKVY